MNAVAKTMISLRHEILMIIAASSEPLCCKDIYEKSKQGMDTRSISIEVNQMTHKSGLLKVARKDKPENFREIAFYKLSDLGREELHKLNSGIHDADMSVQPTVAAPVATAEPIQEKTMNEQVNRTGSFPGILNKAIYNKVVEHPGITITKLIAHVLSQFPEETEKRVRKTISNMVHATKKLRLEGSGDDRTMHLNSAISRCWKQKAAS